MISPRKLDKATVEQAMAGRAAEVAVNLLGPPRRKQGSEWFFGRRQGSLGFIVSGPKAGSWYDHGDGIGGDVFELARHIEGHDFPGAVSRVGEILGVSEAEAPRPVDRREWNRKRDQQAREQEARDAAEKAQKAETALALWHRALDPRGTLAERYLVQARKVPLPDKVAGAAIRFVPDYRWFDKVTGETHVVPIMLALMRDIRTNEPVAVHRTALRAESHWYDGRKWEKPFSTSKKMLGPVNGAAIKLCPDDEITMGLTISEGIESGLAAWRVGFSNVWAVGAAGSIRSFPVLSGLSGLAVAGEDDTSNDSAFSEVALRYHSAGVGVVRVKSPVGGDLADLAEALGAMQ